MKKRFLSLLMAMCLMLTLAPAAFAADAVMTQAELESAISAAPTGGTVEVTGNVTLTTPFSIGKSITLDGNGYTLTASYTDDAVLKATTSENVTIKDVTISSTQSAVDLVHASAHVTIENSTLYAQARGIRYMQSGKSTGSELILDNTKILNSSKPADASYETWADHSGTRGISVWGMDASTITVKNGSEIMGFSYTFNLAGDVDSDGMRNYNDTTINVENSTLMGWTAFNVWSSNTIFKITNSYLKGINNSNGVSDGFATIVVNDNIYGYQGEEWARAQKNTFEIKGGTITTYRSGTAPEDLFRVDSDGVTLVVFDQYESARNKVKLIDGTGTFKTVFYSGWNLDANHWQNFMTDSVYGEENCTRISYPETTLTWTPYGDFN